MLSLLSIQGLKLFIHSVLNMLSDGTVQQRTNTFKLVGTELYQYLAAIVLDKHFLRFCLLSYFFPVFAYNTVHQRLPFLV